MPTSKLQKVLYQIFAMYSGHAGSETSMCDVNMDHLSVSEIMAARLWYRCGMKLSSLESILKLKDRRDITFRDFYSLISKVIDEEEKANIPTQGGSTFEVWL